MSLESRQEGDRIVIVVSGALDIESGPELSAFAQLAIGHPHASRIDIDLSPMSFVDSTGLGVLVTINSAAAAAGEGSDVAQARRSGPPGATADPPRHRVHDRGAAGRFVTFGMQATRAAVRVPFRAD
jgi:anti-anti-sigma factor